MIRRRRSAVAARRQFAEGAFAPLSRAFASAPALALAFPRAGRIVDLLELGPARRLVDIGCGTAAYARLLAARASAPEPICLDLTPGAGVSALAWPEHLPFTDGSVHCVSSFSFLRRFDDDVVHGFGGEISRVLAPGGCALILEIAPVASPLLDSLHRKLFRTGTPSLDLRGWGRLAALFTECQFDGVDLVNAGPFLFPPIPRVGVLLRRASY